MALKRKKKRIYGGIGIIILAFILLAAASGLIIKYIWLDGLGYQQVFWTIKIAQFSLFFIALAIALLYIGINIRLIHKRAQPISLNLGQNMEGVPSTIRVSVKQIKLILYLLAGLIGLVFAFNTSAQWNEFLRFFHAQPFHTVDPIFGIDISFYVFKLPFIEFFQNSLAVLVFLVLIISTIYHLANGGISLMDIKPLPKIHFKKEAKKQLFTNVGIWLFLLAWGYYLDRFQVLYKNNEIIYGANYTDIHVLIPVFWTMIVGCVLLGIYAFIQNYRPHFGKLIKGGILLIAVGIIGQVFAPMLVQQFKVSPSELSMEKPYIKHNIEFTRKAYNLDSVIVKSYDAEDTLTLPQIRKHQTIINNIRIWDQNLTIDTYKQLQEIRLYYVFNNIDLDRYHTDKGYRQVLISARELAPTLPKNAQTWVNQRLQYTHGYGIVMSPTTQKTKEGSPLFYIQDIPPKSDIGMSVQQPAIYYGESKTGYKIVNTKIEELDYAKGDENVYTNYKGKGGVLVDNTFRRLLFSWHFSDMNILFTNYIQKGSKIQFWSDLQTRITKIAPFLALDSDPYIVLDNGQLYWIQDAYTTASHYPYSEPYHREKNYIRNSVKIVINAYDGTVKFYVSDPRDPVIAVYKEIFPDMFHPLDEIPGKLKEHVKYPKDLFEIQLQKFSVYHMSDPQVFYNQEDLWDRPNETYGGRQIEMRPYYLLGSLPGQEKLQYLLISPMTPKGRDNMISWMVVKSDYPGYGQIINYELPKERLLLGPAQIEAKINQNTDISRQLSLWDQRGSKVIRGNLMVIPIENSFLYVEPVFLFSTSVNLPQLKRVIATSGSKVVMEPTLDKAIDALYGNIPIPKIKADSLQGGKISPQKVKAIISPQLQELKATWKEMQKSLQNGDWESFGEKMDKMDGLLDKSLEEEK